MSEEKKDINPTMKGLGQCSQLSSIVTGLRCRTRRTTEQPRGGSIKDQSQLGGRRLDKIQPISRRV